MEISAFHVVRVVSAHERRTPSQGGCGGSVLRCERVEVREQRTILVYRGVDKWSVITGDKSRETGMELTEDTVQINSNRVSDIEGTEQGSLVSGISKVRVRRPSVIEIRSASTK